MRNKKEWAANLTLADMPNSDMVLVAQACGLEVAAKLLTELPGLSITIPKSGMKKLINKYISENYTGGNAKELALECNVSIRHIYNMINKKKSELE